MNGFKKNLGLIFILLAFLPVYSAWADSSVNTEPTVVATTTPTQAKKIKVAAVQTSAVKKDFKWFFKYGCNCAQCRAFQQQQADEEERLKNNFQP